MTSGWFRVALRLVDDYRLDTSLAAGDDRLESLFHETNATSLQWDSLSGLSSPFRSRERVTLYRDV